MRYLIMTCALWVTACGGSSKKDAELLNEASLLHNEAVAIAGDLKVHLSQLEVDSTVVSIDSLKVWRQLLTQWNEELVEVPGNEHEHDHEGGNDHDHDHHHQPADQVTAAEMLLIQRDRKERIELLSNRIKK